MFNEKKFTLNDNGSFLLEVKKLKVSIACFASFTSFENVNKLGHFTYKSIFYME